MQHQGASEERFYKQQSYRPNRRFAGSITSWARKEDPDENQDRECRADASRRAVSEFNQCLDAGMMRQQTAVAKRPVGSAAGARARSPYNRPPEDHQNHYGDRRPGKGGEPSSTAQ